MTPAPAYLSAETRAPGTIRTNRVVLALLGLALFLAGTAAVLVGLGVLGSARALRPVLDRPVETFVGDNRWIWAVVAATAALLALFSLLWLLMQARSNRLSTLPLEQRGSGGHTILNASALSAAVVRDIQDIRGVDRATAHLRGSPPDHELSIHVQLDGRVPARDIHERVVHRVIADARRALAVDSLATRLELDLPKVAQRDIR